MKARAFEAVASVSDQALSAGVGFVASVFVGRVLGPEGLGVFALGTVMLVALNGVQNGLILQGFAVLGARVVDDERASYRAGIYWLDRLAASSLLAIGALALVAAWKALGWETSRVTALLAALLFYFFSSLQNLIRRELYLDHRPAAALAQSSSYIALVAAGLALLHWSGAVTVGKVYLVLSICSLLVCLVQLRLIAVHMRWPGRLRLRVVAGQQWAFGRWLLLSIPFFIGTYQGYYVLVGYLLSWDAAGILRGADVLVLPYEQVVIGLTLLFTPRAAGSLPAMSVPERRRWCARASWQLLAIGATYSLALLFFGKILVARLFGGTFAQSSSIVPILAVLPLLHSMAAPANVALMALLRPRSNFTSRVAATVVSAVVGSVLTAIFGLRGAAFGVVLSVATFTVCLWIALERHLRRADDSPDEVSLA